MTFDTSLLFGFEDTITIEPFSALSSAQAPTYGAAVTYQAQVTEEAVRIFADGREVTSRVRVVLPDLVTVDQRSRVTLPARCIPNQPPILGLGPSLRGLGMDHTVIRL